MTLIRELIDIPTQVRDGDFVLKLTSGVAEDHAVATVESYEVTQQIASAFNEALGLVAGAGETGESQATYLHGSFGSGKSHFMAVLHLLLSGNTAARAKPELHEAIAAHDDRLDGKRFLLLPIHFLDARSMEQKILGGYVERIAALHPDAPVPAVFIADAIVQTELPGLRTRLNEDAFLDGLNGGTSGSDEWGEFGTTWTTEAVDAALAAPATSDERQALAAAYIGTYRTATSDEALATGEGFIDLSRGLAAISAHARDLGYDGIVLFLDELILWLASTIGNLDMVQREAQKLTNLVEGSAAGRPIPIVSFVARQRDLRELVGDHVVGAERLSFADTLALQSAGSARSPSKPATCPSSPSGDCSAPWAPAPTRRCATPSTACCAAAMTCGRCCWAPTPTPTCSAPSTPSRPPWCGPSSTSPKPSSASARPSRSCCNCSSTTATSSSWARSSPSATCGTSSPPATSPSPQRCAPCSTGPSASTAPACAPWCWPSTGSTRPRPPATTPGGPPSSGTTG